MSIGVYSAYNRASIIPLDSAAPLKTDLVGLSPIPSLSEVTLFGYVKPRFAEPTEKISSTDDPGTYKSKFYFQYRPWSYSTGSPTYQFPGVWMTLAIDMLMRTSKNSTSGVAFSLDAKQFVADDDGGTYTTDARVLETILASTIAADEKWLAIAMTSTLPAGEVTVYLIDPEDGTILYTESDTDVQDGNAHPFIGGTPPNGNSHFVRLGGQDPNNVVTNTDEDYKLGEFCIWHVLKTPAQLQAFAQVGFAAINEPVGLVLDWNFMLDWRNNDPAVITDQSGNGNHGVISDTGIQNQFSTDNPVPVFIPQQTSNEHDISTFNIFSGTAGALYMGVYARNATAPTAAALVAGTGALTTATDTLDGINTKDVDIAQPDTGADYTVYFVQDTTGSGDYSEVYEFDYTSPTKYSETVGTYQNEPLASITAIEYSWFDSVDFDNLGPAKVTGNTEVTDASGLLEITLPTNISTAKGSQGVMSLKVVSGGKTRTGSHIATVK